MSELLSNTIEMLKPLDEGAMVEARARQDILTKPFTLDELKTVVREALRQV